MTLSEHLKKEQLEQVASAWNKLNWFQRNIFLISVLSRTIPRRAYWWFGNYLIRRRARYAYGYPAHWLNNSTRWKP